MQSSEKEKFSFYFFCLPGRIAGVKVLYFNFGAAAYAIEG
jgi:hypothetical protein